MANVALDPHAAVVTTASGAPALTTADGTPLARALARSQRRARRRAFLLVLPLLAFILITFVVPIGQMLQRSFYNDGFSANMPQVSRLVRADRARHRSRRRGLGRAGRRPDRRRRGTHRRDGRHADQL